MDQSRPRHQTHPLPLIIERADLDRPLHRYLAWITTSLAWLLWFSLWLPFLLIALRAIGWLGGINHLPLADYSSPLSLDSFFTLLELIPDVITIALAIILISYLGEKLRARFSHRAAPWRPVGMARLATGEALDPALQASWQATRIIYVEHGPLGRVSNAYSKRPD
jgi:poly-beta-1,6-N-acetyl-D-glucosamine biosynthesis protein PgaD